MTIARLARPEIRALRPYEAAAQVDDTIRLNANEAPWSASDQFRRPLNRYPEIRPRRLERALANHYGCEPERLLVTRGSSEAIDLLIRVFCRPGIDNVVTTTPTFSMYRHYAAIQGAAIREVESARERDFAVDIDALLQACDADTRLVFICSPNNPTGTLLPRGDLIDLLERRSDRSAVVLDEAYIEFAGEPSATELLDRFDNLIVLRTLSKALACAGARCGAVIGSSAVIDMVDAVQAPYAMATPVIECVEDALQADSLREARRRVGEMIAERQRLMEAMTGFPFVRRIWPTSANFFLAHVDDVGKLLRQCESDKVLLRYFGGSLADCVRISVGSRAENDRLLQSCAAVAGS